MNAKLLFLSIITSGYAVLYGLPVQAGGGDTGGGMVVACRNDKGELTSVEMLDIYEGRVLSKYKYLDPKDLSESNQVALANKEEQVLKVFDGLDQPNVRLKLREDYEFMKRAVDPLSDEAELESTQDSFHIVSPNKRQLKLPKKCQIEQLAIYRDHYAPYPLLVNTELYNALDKLNRTAFFLHETIYQRMRSYAVKNSLATRKLVAHVMALPGSGTDTLKSNAGSLTNPLEGVTANTGYECRSVGKDGPLRKTGLGWSFIMIKNERGETVLHFEAMNNELIYARTTVNLHGDWMPPFNELADRKQWGTRSSYHTGIITWNELGLVQVQVQFKTDEKMNVKASISTIDPLDREYTDPAEFTCWPRNPSQDPATAKADGGQ